MRVTTHKGLYVLGVSGGVDSMVLLDILSKQHGVELIVAHFNHGIRAEAHEDEKFVVSEARKYGVKVEVGHGDLGKSASEDKARRARYGFLEKVRRKYRADAIITAHHQDDLIETAVINLLRGTGRRGLSSIAANPTVKRPLIGVAKARLLDYAKDHEVAWREDPSNQDTSYLRNYIRQQLLVSLMPKDRKQLISSLDKVAKTNFQLDRLLATISQKVELKGQIKRSLFSSLPLQISNELVIHWLRELPMHQFDRKTVERLSLAIRTAPAGTKHEVGKKRWLVVERETARFK